MDTEQTVADLRAWQQETHCPLPRPIYDTAYLEHCGVVVDLADGTYFEPRDDWHDFARRWLAEQQRRGRTPTLERMAAAIHKACSNRYDRTLCRAIALTVLPICAGPTGLTPEKQHTEAELSLRPHCPLPIALSPLDASEQACYAVPSRP